jgi:uncharacterized integral membrane protein
MRPQRPTVGDVLVAAGGTVIFLFSFAPFVAYDDALVRSARGDDAGFSGRFSAWSAQTFMAPLTWFVIVAGLLLVALAAVRIARGGDPARLGVSAGQAQLGLGMFVFFVLLGYALANKDMMFGIDDVNADVRAVLDFPLTFGWGGVLMLVGAVLALGGALLNHFGIDPLRPARPPATPYQAPTYPPPVEFHDVPTDQPQSQPYPPPVQFHEQSNEQ